MRRSVAIASVLAALSFGSVPAFAFQETPVPPARPRRCRNPLRRSTPSNSALPAPPAPPKTSRADFKLFGYTVLPKLNFGLDVLYGEDEQQLQLQGPTHARGEWRRHRPRQGQAPLLGAPSIPASQA